MLLEEFHKNNGSSGLKQWNIKKREFSIEMHQLKTFLSRLTIKTFYGEEIPKESNEYLCFIDFIDWLCNATNRTILFRGSNPSTIYNAKLSELKCFSDRIFMLGEKSHRFETFSGDGISIEDCSYRVFEIIFDKFYVDICHNTNPKVESFLSINPEIKAFFSDVGNRTRFVSIIEKQSDPNKSHIKDYYFSLLHTMNEIIAVNTKNKSIKKNSYFISTTTKIKIAKQFRHSIIIATWIPSCERNQQIIKSCDVNKYDEFIEEIGLPTYHVSPYPYQSEICIKGGILPHYIIGFSYEGSFIVNPHLLTQISASYDFESLLKDGIFINQTSFDDEFQKTKYKERYLCIDGYYLEY